ncbi:MAG: hydrogenase iron-sulfur subunit [Nitrospirota bacterium]
MINSFEPVIVGFFCNWCAYRAADRAGTLRLHSAPNLRIIRVMCSGRVEPQLVLKALREGADGVLIAGCHPGECHYEAGNIRTLGRFHLVRNLAGQFGIERERIQLAWVSASEGAALSEKINRMTAALRALGPLQWPQVISGRRQ